MTGTLYGIGVGPGDPELLTLKGHALLTAADVIAYPAPEGGESFARAIVAKFLDNGQREIVIPVPMRSARFPARAIYDRAAEEIGAELQAGRNVAVLCEGDPFFYGSFMYLFERMADHFPIEIVPGVSSVMAAGAASARPLAARNDVMSIVPAPLPDPEIEAALRAADAISIIKIGRHFKRIRSIIDRLQMISCAHYLERVTLPLQVVRPLASLDPDHAAPYFSMILIYRGAEQWIGERPLATASVEPSQQESRP